MTKKDFDLVAYYKEEVIRLEKRVAKLETQRAELEKMVKNFQRRFLQMPEFYATTLPRGGE